eukprot:scaffold365419_cov36-Prasinocladus_malaysianus.AAC.1
MAVARVSIKLGIGLAKGPGGHQFTMLRCSEAIKAFCRHKGACRREQRKMRNFCAVADPGASQRMGEGLLQLISVLLSKP